MPSNATRIAVQTRVIKACIKALLKAGYALTVSYERGCDIDNMPVVGSTKAKAIFDAVNAVDDCHLFVHRPDQQDKPIAENSHREQWINCEGWISLVLGNDGWDVISDYTLSLESVLAPVNELADQLSAA